MDSDYTIMALYSSNKKEDEQWEQVKLGKGESHRFEKKTEDMDGWIAVRKILSIK